MKIWTKSSKTPTGSAQETQRSDSICLSPLLVAAAVSMALMTSGAVYAKDYTRSCQATYTVGAATPTGDRLEGAQFRFSGRGTIGYFNPNEARKRARRNIDECVDAAWNSRHGTSTPSECTSGNQIFDYPFTGLHFGIQQAVCGANPGQSEVMVDISVLYDGKEGCLLDTNFWNRVVTRAYRIQCPTREFERGVDRPGMDYRNFDLDSADPQQCRDACIADAPRCRAWTYVNPGVQGPHARCWLKSGVPAPRPSSCCTSGVLSDM